MLSFGLVGINFLAKKEIQLAIVIREVASEPVSLRS